MKQLFIVALLALLAGCATLTEAEKVERRYERDNYLIERHEKYLSDLALCHALRGFLIETPVLGSHIQHHNYTPWTWRCSRF